MTLEELYTIITDRKKNLPNNSYVASLLQKGEDRIIQKFGEESIEVVIAAKNNEKERLIQELADLFFHIEVLLVLTGISLQDIYTALEIRKK